jgi:mannosyltransferase OCH1-like enzyme
MRRFGNDIADDSAEWQILESLYINYFLAYKEPKVDLIPKKIHQIWVGSPLPDKFKKYTDSWQRMNPEWEYRLWTDKDVDDINIEKRECFDVAKNFGMKSDILRYEILSQQGGVYADTDFECLKPFDFLCYLNFFASSAYTEYPYIYNSLIACTPFHPIIELCKKDISVFYSGNSSKVIMKETGPYYFTKCFYSGVKNHSDKVVAFPVEYFFPLHHRDREIKDPYSCVTENSVAIHHWAVSWINKKR